MALLEKGIPFSTSYVNILNGKQFTTEFLSINPRGEVPVLVDDNTRYIPDSAHIIDYLEDNFTNGNPPASLSDCYNVSKCQSVKRKLIFLLVFSVRSPAPSSG